MGKFDLFSIMLQKPIYTAGETLIGSVNMRLKEKLKINGINLLLIGDGRVHWSETQNLQNHNGLETIHYVSNEEYLKLNILLVEKQQSDTDLYLEAGDQSFPFSVLLPTNLPTSFEHQFGRVRYSLTVIIDIPWSFNKELERCFTVLSILDLNLNPSLKQPIGASETEFMCCSICKNNPISCLFNIKKGGYVPGESLIFNAFIDNKSDKCIKRMHVSLIQNIIFYAHKPKKTKNCFRNIASVSFNKRIPPRTSEYWRKGTLIIPPVISSSNETCKIIDINYTIVLSFDASGVLISTSISIPIIIGTIPIMGEKEKLSYLEKNFNQLEPTYASCSFDNNSKNYFTEPNLAKIKNKNYESNFKPYYPFYENYKL